MVNVVKSKNNNNNNKMELSQSERMEIMESMDPQTQSTNMNTVEITEKTKGPLSIPTKIKIVAPPLLLSPETRSADPDDHEMSLLSPHSELDVDGESVAVPSSILLSPEFEKNKEENGNQNENAFSPPQRVR